MPTVLRGVSMAVSYDCANVRNEVPYLDVATTCVDVQTAVSLLDALSPVNVLEDVQ